METVIIDLQSVIRGFLLRREIIQSVRNEYEEFFFRIEEDSDRNTITWCDSVKLCYPSFIAKVEFQPIGRQPDDARTQVASTPIQDSVSVSSIEAGDQMYPCENADSTPLVLNEYPSEREELLQLREQLALELLWVKQAIQSRVQYLQALSEMKK